MKKEGLVNFTVTGLPSRDALANAVGISAEITGAVERLREVEERIKLLGGDSEETVEWLRGMNGWIAAVEKRAEPAIEWLRIAAAWLLIPDEHKDEGDWQFATIAVMQTLIEARVQYLVQYRFVPRDKIIEAVRRIAQITSGRGLSDGGICFAIENAITNATQATLIQPRRCEYRLCSFLDGEVDTAERRGTSIMTELQPTKQGLERAASILEHIHAKKQRGAPNGVHSVFVEDEWNRNKDVKAKYIADKWDAMTDDDRRRYHEDCFKRGTYVGKGYETFLEKNGGKIKGRERPITKVLEKLRRNEQKKGK